MTATSEGIGRVLPLTLGWEHLPKTVSVLGADPSVRLREPVPAVLCEVEDGWILLDCGFNTPTVRDLALRRRFHGDDHIVPELPAATEPDVDPLIAAFALVGVDPADVVAVALSHLHTDHVGGLRHFAGLVPVHIQRAELDHGFGEHPGPERQGILRIDFDDPHIDWRLADGPVDIAPGLRAVPTVGHTPGHQSFVVSLAAGDGFIFAFDAADLTENLDDEVSVGALYGGTAQDSVAAIRRLKAFAAETGYRLVPGHDPVAWPALCADLGVPTFT